MIDNEIVFNLLQTPVRQFGARVELYEGATLADTYSQYYALKGLTVDRVGDSKFFGYGICQKLNVHLIDRERYIHITTIDSFIVYLGIGENYINPFPQFYVSEVHRDENTNELSITAYDALYKASAHTVAELSFTTGYTIQEFTAACASLLGLSDAYIINASDSFTTAYESGANFDGTETIREALDAVAEATQSIYYIDSLNRLVFKRLDMSGAEVYRIDKENYISLKSGDNRRLSKISHVTELGDNVSVAIAESGSTQYIRNNPFYDLRDDVGTLLNNAIAAVGGLTINQFECEWRGNYLLEVGDKITLETKDNDIVTSYILNDVIEYNGGLIQKTQWIYEDNEEETEENPATIGDALKQTYARVDKANKQIELVASETESNTESISTLQLNTESITASVSSIETHINEELEGVNGNIEELTSRVDATMSAEDVRLEIQTGLSNGVDKVTTSTGFTFNDEGLTVEKSNSEMKTQITEDGMIVYKNNEAVLTANNVGVDAVNLHATTYLIIGTNSRFEDFGTNRTGCFWIGG